MTEVMSSYSGRGDWIRTSGLLLPKQTRYQAAPHPDGQIWLAIMEGSNLTPPKPFVHLGITRPG